MHTPAMDKSAHRRRNVGGRLKQRLAQLLLRSSCTTNITTAFVDGLSKADGTGRPRQEEPPPPHSPYFCTPCVYERPKFEKGSRRSRGLGASLDGGAAAASGRHSVHSDDLLPSPLLAANGAKKQSRSRPRSPLASWRHGSGSYSFGDSARRRPKMTSALYSSSSSTDTDDELAPYSADDEEAEARTLFSLLSFSSDSTSEFYHTNSKNARRRALPRTSCEPMAFRPLLSAPPARTTKHHECSSDRNKESTMKKQQLVVGTGPAVCSGSDGMAVVKRSSNPYADFLSSMVEMVVGRRIASVGKMEELLRSYLSLNSPEHHQAILAAFDDVWETVFSKV